MKFLKISVLIMAIVGQTMTTGGGHGQDTSNYRTSSVNNGSEGASSTSSGGGSSIKFGGSIPFISREISGATSSRRFVGVSSGGFDKNEVPKPYDFDYKSADKQGNTHYHREEADASGTVRGSYGYTNAQGLYRVVDYTADANGFRASIRTNEPGTDDKKSPADVQMSAELPPAGINDKYSGIGGPRDFAPRTATGEKIKFDVPLIPVRNPARMEGPASTPHIGTVVRQTYKTQVIYHPGSVGRPKSDEDDDEEE